MRLDESLKQIRKNLEDSLKIIDEIEKEIASYDLNLIDSVFEELIDAAEKIASVKGIEEKHRELLKKLADLKQMTSTKDSRDENKSNAEHYQDRTPQSDISLLNIKSKNEIEGLDRSDHGSDEPKPLGAEDPEVQRFIKLCEDIVPGFKPEILDKIAHELIRQQDNASLGKLTVQDIISVVGVSPPVVSSILTIMSGKKFIKIDKSRHPAAIYWIDRKKLESLTHKS